MLYFRKISKLLLLCFTSLLMLTQYQTGFSPVMRACLHTACVNSISCLSYENRKLGSSVSHQRETMPTEHFKPNIKYFWLVYFLWGFQNFVSSMTVSPTSTCISQCCLTEIASWGHHIFRGKGLEILAISTCESYDFDLSIKVLQ